jgi:hypothetical protein
MQTIPFWLEWLIVVTVSFVVGYILGYTTYTFF